MGCSFLLIMLQGPLCRIKWKQERTCRCKNKAGKCMRIDRLLTVCLNQLNLLFNLRQLINIKTVPFGDSGDAIAKTLQVKVLIWRMCRIGIQAKAQQNAFDAQNLFEGTDNRYTATAAHRNGDFPVS